MLVDYHVHTAHSIDAKNDLDQYCERALEIGLAQICFTNHCEIDKKRNDNFIVFDDQRQAIDRKGIERLFNEINRCREQYLRSGLDVRIGIEIGFFPGIEKQIDLLIDNIPVDYVLGSIHCLEHICIDSSREYPEYFDRHPAQTMITNYYQAIHELVGSGLFDAVAHLDVYKKYGIKHYGSHISYLPRELLNAILRTMKEKNIALEINTAGLRRIDQIYPSEDIMQLAAGIGIDLLVIGSDAHSVGDLGKGLNKGYDYIKSFGYKEVSTFKNRKITKIKPEGKIQITDD
jgi:histidinol-phosphatase (PHP family)